MSVVVLLAAGGVAAYLVELHPDAARVAAPLPNRVMSHQTVGLVAQQKTSGSKLLQLLGPQRTLQFSRVDRAQQQVGSPQWTADLMAGNSYIFIFLPTEDCLAATGSARHLKVTLEHCDLKAAQRWRRKKAGVVSQGHDFYQYANLGDRDCLSQSGEQAGQVGAALAPCSPSAPVAQLIAFWWSSV